MFGKRIGLSVLVIFFLTHTPITEAALRMLSCRSIQPESSTAFDAITEARRTAFEANHSAIAVKDWQEYGGTPASQGELRLAMDLEYKCSENQLEMIRVAMPVLFGFSLLVPLMVYALVELRCKCVSAETWESVE